VLHYNLKLLNKKLTEFLAFEQYNIVL